MARSPCPVHDPAEDMEPPDIQDKRFQLAMLRAKRTGTGSERTVRRGVIKDDRPFKNLMYFGSKRLPAFRSVAGSLAEEGEVDVDG